MKATTETKIREDMKTLPVILVLALLLLIFFMTGPVGVALCLISGGLVLFLFKTARLIYFVCCKIGRTK